jgi:uncharacterized protein YabE (DUF348 family)
MELRTMWDRYKNRGLVIFGSLALVLVPMIGYFSAQATQPKQVTFSLDGDIRTVATKADTVEEFLTERNIAVTKKDSLQPTPQTELSNGAVITLHTVWSIPVQIDGQTKVIETLSRDVAGALKDGGITLGVSDRVKPALTAVLTKESSIQVKRVMEKMVQVEERVTFQEIRKNDPFLTKGKTRVLQSGQEGKAIAHYKLVMEDGKEVSRDSCRYCSRCASDRRSTTKGHGRFSRYGLTWRKSV